MAYYPGIGRNEVNQFNVLKEPYFYQSTQAILSPQRARFMDDYKFNLEPATDDRPFFHQFFKWSSLQEILSLRGQGGMPVLEWGYLTLVVTLLIGASLLMRTTAALNGIDVGFETGNLLTGETRLTADAYQDAETRRTYLERVVESLSAIPGTRGSTLIAGMPFSGDGSSMPLRPRTTRGWSSSSCS